ncbi:MAG: hypothetical protein ACYC45_09780 [Acidithiobacillus ferriphilus]
MPGTKPAHSPMARFCHKIYSPNTLDHYSGAHFWEMLGTCAKDAFDLARMSSSRFFLLRADLAWPSFVRRMHETPLCKMVMLLRRKYTRIVP